MKRFITILCLAIGLVASAAEKEQKFILRGNIHQADTVAWAPIDSVFVQITSVATQEPVRFEVLNGNDSLKLANHELRLMVYGAPGRYNLTLDKEGYQPKVTEVRRVYKDQDVVWIGTQQLKRERHHELREVEVVATAIKMVMNGDTIVYNADAFNLAEGSMLDALVRQLPGAELERNGQIKVNGRAVNSLLINGKDFFKGDPQVALENLPAYAVKNVKVYDKAGDDDYLTQASAKLSRREDEENLVMDVVLKKEYHIGLMGNVTAGYGTDNHWLGKAFGFAMGQKFTVGLVLNANNIHDEGNYSEYSKDWMDYSQPTTGEKTVESSGINYNFDDKEGSKIKVEGNVRYSHDKILSDVTESITEFYPGSPNLYSRSLKRETTREHSVSTWHSFSYSGDYAFVTVSPDFSWNRSKGGAKIRRATFSALPYETSRSEALDSVFKYPESERYSDILLSRIASTDGTDTDYFTGSLSSSVRYRHPSMAGSIFGSVNGSYTSNTYKSRDMMQQHLRPKQAAEALHLDRYYAKPSSSGYVMPKFGYERTWSTMDEVYRRKIQFSAWGEYNYQRQKATPEVFSAELTPDFQLPELLSVVNPQGAVQSLTDSYCSETDTHDATVKASLNWSRDQVAPGDSTPNFEPFFGVSVSGKVKHESLDYLNAGGTHEFVAKTYVHPAASARFTLYSNNKLRYMYGQVEYNLSYSDPSLNLFLRTRSSVNPLVIYNNSARRLKSGLNQRASLYFVRYGRGASDDQTSASFNFTSASNRVGQASVYNPATGVTTYTPMNINGNWSVDGHISHNRFFNKHIGITGYFRSSYSHNVDFVSSTSAAPEKSLVHDLRLNGDLGLVYKITEQMGFQLKGEIAWNKATSPRPDFTPVSTLNYGAEFYFFGRLPWDMEIVSEFSANFRHGYFSPELNKTQWLWNAHISKSILKGDLTFKLSGHDILGQINPLRVTVTGAMRDEIHTNVLGRYAMLSISYKFRKK